MSITEQIVTDKKGNHSCSASCKPIQKAIRTGRRNGRDKSL